MCRVLTPITATVQSGPAHFQIHPWEVSPPCLRATRLQTNVRIRGASGPICVRAISTILQPCSVTNNQVLTTNSSLSMRSLMPSRPYPCCFSFQCTLLPCLFAWQTLSVCHVVRTQTLAITCICSSKTIQLLGGE